MNPKLGVVIRLIRWSNFPTLLQAKNFIVKNTDPHHRHIQPSVFVTL